MKHTTKYNLVYLVLIMGVFGGALGYGVYFRRPFIPIFAIVVIFLFPNVIQGFFWHEFFLGRHLIRQGKWEGAISHLEKFLDQLQKSPWLKFLILLRWASYTNQVEAMALSNLGVAQVNTAQLEKAEQSFKKARELDPGYAIPYFNLALIELLRSHESRARELWQSSQSLGYRKVPFERVKALSETLKKQGKKT